MKRILSILLLLVLLAPVGADAAEYPACDCSYFQCDCFIQLGDEGPVVHKIIMLMIEKGYCPPEQEVSIFDEGARQGVMRLQETFGLEKTGMLDDDTLTALIWDCLPDELDQTDPESRFDYNWIPTDGGKKRHTQEKCSKMEDPRKISVRNAKALGVEPCRRCNEEDLPIQKAD